MSSNYAAICLSHDPALVADDRDGHDEAIQTARTRHPRCDVVIGRYSGGLVEVECLGWRCNHNDVRTIEADWLRLLALAPAQMVVDARLRSCWTRDRVRPMREELGMEPS